MRCIMRIGSVQTVQLLNDGQMSELWFANDGQTLVNDGEMSILPKPEFRFFSFYESILQFL